MSDPALDPRCRVCFADKLRTLAERHGAPGRTGELHDALWAAVCDAPAGAPAPLRAAAALAVLARETGATDPYATEKAHANATMLSHLPAIAARTRASADPLAAAVRAAMAGNALDVATPHAGDFETALERHLEQPLAVDHLEELRARLRHARSLLVLADNAGEIALDRLLVEALAVPETTVVVRGGAAWNDATLEDAEAVGLTRVARVIDNGDTVPGTILSRVRPEVRDLYERADVVIAKGQGNYETLFAERREGLFFVLLLKCDVVAEMLAQPLGGGVVLHAPWHP